MKDFIKFILTMLLTAVFTIIILFNASKVFIPKWVDHHGNMMTFIMNGFYEEEKDSLEIIFTGNSDVYRGISPMILYKEYGITSYNFVSAGQRSWIAYAMLEEALRYQTPKLILFNVDELYRDNQTSIGNYSKVYDNMKFSKVKFDAVFDKTYEKSRIGRVSHFLPILSYHSRYVELTNEDFKYAYYDKNNPTKGMDLIAYRVPYKEKNNYMEYTTEQAEMPETNREYLDKMVQLCKDKGVTLVLFEVPSPDSWDYSKHNELEAYAKEKNLDFIDLNLYNEEIGMNWAEDTSDGGDHLNVFGAEKVTKFLSDYLVENYELTDRRKDKKYNKWNEQYEQYLKIKEYEIQYAKNENMY